MVKLLLIALLYLNPSQAAQLQLEVEEPQVELGKSLSARLIYRGAADPGSANLSRWESSFFIDRQRSQALELASGEVEVVERLKLYPRQTGELLLSALALGGAVSEPLSITAKPAIRDGIDGQPTWLKLPETVWVGERIESCVAMTLFDARNNMKVELPEFNQFVVVEGHSTVQREASLEQAQQCWWLTAEVAGYLTLELPPVIQRGRGKWVFYLPAQVIKVMPLPSYLPPGIALGEPRLTVQGAPNHWRIQVEREGSQQEEVYGVRTALAQAVRLPVSAIVQSDNTYRVPYPEWAWGETPVVTLRFFNPQLGVLDTTTLTLPAVWRAPLWFNLLLLLSATLLLVLGVRLSLGVLRWWRWRTALRAAIAQMNSAQELRQLLLRSGCPASHSGQFVTLEGWAQSINDVQATKLADQLNRLCFAAHSELDLNRVKRELRRLAFRR